MQQHTTVASESTWMLLLQLQANGWSYMVVYATARQCKRSVFGMHNWGGNLGFLGFSILAIMGKPPETAALSHWA